MSEAFSSAIPLFLFHDSQLKMQRQGKETMEKGERKRVVRRTSNSERKNAGRRKRKAIPICAENSVPLHD